MASLYRWHMSADADSPLADSVTDGGNFPSQADAEAWLTDEWPELSEMGVQAVTLLCDDTVVYGPMSLSP